MNHDTILTGFQRDGFVIVPELFTPSECETLKKEARALLDQPSQTGVTRKPTVYVGAALASPLFHALASDQRLLPYLWQLIPEGPMFLSDKVVYKSASQRFASPWHIDQAYWQGTRPKISIWIALDDVAADNGALIVVPGSHQRIWEHVHGTGASSNGEFLSTTNRTWTSADEHICALRRGGVIIFSDRLLHASTENISGKDRYSLISTYQAAGADEPFDVNFPDRHVLPILPVEQTVN